MLFRRTATSPSHQKEGVTPLYLAVTVTFYRAFERDCRSLSTKNNDISLEHTAGSINYTLFENYSKCRI